MVNTRTLFYTDFSFSLSLSLLNIVRIVNLTKLKISRQPQSTGHGHSRGFHRDGTQSTSSGRRFTVSTFFAGLSFRQHYFDGKFVRNIGYSLFSLSFLEYESNRRTKANRTNHIRFRNSFNNNFLLLFSAVVRAARRTALPKH